MIFPENTRRISFVKLFDSSREHGLKGSTTLQLFFIVFLTHKFKQEELYYDNALLLELYFFYVFTYVLLDIRFWM